MDLSILKEYNRSRIIELFSSIDGKKALVIDKHVEVILKITVEKQILKENGITATYILMDDLNLENS